MASDQDKKVDITGTRYDDTMTVEGDGDDHADMVRENRAASTAPIGTPTKDPCERYGHNPKYWIDEHGQAHEVSPRVCRHCGTPY